MDKTKPTLGYWAIRGLVANLKYQLAYQGVDYNLIQYGKEGVPQWHEEVKPKMKGEGMDFPNLPYFIDGDVKISETLAIHHYIAAKWKPELLGGSDPATQSKMKMLDFIIYDFKMKVTMPQYQSDDKSKVVEAYQQILPNILDFMGDHKFLTGDTPTYHDFYFFEAFQSSAFLTEGKIYEEYPKLKQYHDNMKNLPGLKEYLETCEEREMMFNGAPYAKLNGSAGF